jgi:hypothetical protein
LSTSPATLATAGLVSIQPECCRGNEFTAATLHRAESVHVSYHNEQTRRGRRSFKITEYNLVVTQRGSVPALPLAGVSLAEATQYSHLLTSLGVPISWIMAVPVSQ